MSESKLVGPLVMLVDDDGELVRQAQKELEPTLGPIVTFVDPVAALRHLESGEQYEALVVAVSMKPVAGLDLLRVARKHNSFVQVLLLASNGSYDLALRGLQLGAVDFVLKPVQDWTALGRSVRRALGERDLKIERARLLKELMVRNDELSRAVDLLRKTNEIAEVMHGSHDVADVLHILLRTASEVLDAQRISIMIRDPKHDEMAIQVAQGISKAVIKEVRVRAGEGIAGRVIAEGRPIVVSDAASDERVPQADDKDGRYIRRSFMCIPIYLSSADKVMGVVNITERASDRAFSATEAEFVSHLARQAAHALMSAALWKRTSRK